MDSSGTHYDVLGVRPGATGDEIDDAFRRLAKVVHPDAGGDATMFDVLVASYTVLRDPLSRRRYDASLESTAAPTGPTDTDRTDGAPGQAEWEPEDLTFADWAEDIATRPYGGNSYSDYTKEQWEEALNMSRPRAILRTAFAARHRPTAWPLADPGTGSQEVNGCVGYMVLLAVFLPFVFLFSWLVSR